MSHFDYVITGGCGFIGLNFVNFLLKTEPESKICIIDKLTKQSNNTNLLNSNIKLFVEDINNSEYIFNSNTISNVVHFAADSHVDRSISTPEPFIMSNINGTFRILENIRKYTPSTRLHHVSTDEVYGSISNGKFTERSTYYPSSVYSSSKASSDMLVISYIKTYKLKASISNCCNNYGKYQHEEKLIPRYIKCLKSNNKLPLFNNGLNVREWIHVDDHNKIVYDILKSDNYEKFNIGSNEELSNIELLKILHNEAILLGKDVGDFNNTIDMTVSDRLGHDLRYAVDSTYLDNKIGFSISNNIRSSAKELINHYWV